MKPTTLIAAILGAGVIAGIIAGVMIGGLPTWLKPGLSEREEREACEAALRARVGDFTLGESPAFDHSQWPHAVLIHAYPGHSAICRFARDGTMTAEIDGR